MLHRETLVCELFQVPFREQVAFVWSCIEVASGLEGSRFC